MEEIKTITMAHSPSLDSADGAIERFQVNGEMALVTWFRQKKKDGGVVKVNGKFVERIDY